MEDNKYDVIIKIVIIGESGVGKTNLLNRYTTDEYNQNAKATIGMDFTSKEIQIDNVAVKAQFWDTAGQEKYMSIARSYYKLANGVLLVYDVTNRETFLKTKNWLNEIKSNSPEGTKIMLVGNKNDLIDQKKVSSEEGSEFASDNGMFFWETSALTNDGQCVHKAFNVLLEECLKGVYQEYETEEEENLNAIRKNTKVLQLPNSIEESKKKSGCC